ncbi:GNAT family N-acetyltransferase [Rhodopseudomonas palustris]|uniref:GCN5-related N-acetyltransferase n=1 Tax=Rhodopseudomonas palustris (strain BisB18) TaxID=316056 RepID=Q216U1_RHOPB
MTTGAIQPVPPLMTERLRLARRRIADLEDCLAMDMDPRVAAYAFDQIEPHQHRARIRAAIAADQDPQLGFWTVRDRSSDQFVGWVYVKPFQQSALLEVGFRFCHQHWGRGLAGEAMWRLISHAFVALDAQAVCAITNPKNSRAIALLHRLGFNQHGYVEAYGSAGPFFVCLRDP